jgi:hypothetical protein
MKINIKTTDTIDDFVRWTLEAEDTDNETFRNECLVEFVVNKNDKHEIIATYISDALKTIINKLNK